MRACMEVLSIVREGVGIEMVRHDKHHGSLNKLIVPRLSEGADTLPPRVKKKKEDSLTMLKNNLWKFHSWIKKMNS